MSLKQWITRSSAALALALAAPGCVVDDGGGDDVVVVEPERTGVLTVLYTIDSDTDPTLCSDYGAYYLELIVYDGSGREYVEAEALCEDFALSVELPEGNYSADATLVDDLDEAVSVTLPLDAIRVTADTELTIDVDFPTGSML